MCLAEIHTGEVRSGEVRLSRFCPGEIRQDKVRPVEISTREVRLQKEVPLTQGVPSYCCDAHGCLDHSFGGMRYEQIRKDSVAVAHLHLVANLELRIQTPSVPRGQARVASYSGTVPEGPRERGGGAPQALDGLGNRKLNYAHGILERP